MLGDLTRTECLIMDVLESEGGAGYSLEDLVERLPEVSWSEVFEAVDRLSRRGAVRMWRRGFNYLLASAGSQTRCTVGA